MKCPYCGKAFDTWKSVRAHSSKCQSNDHSYVITLEYGPISYEEIANLSISDFKSRYPRISGPKKLAFCKTMRKYGFDANKQFTLETAKQAAIDFFREKGRNPTSRDTYSNSSLATDNWCKERFGSWNNFLQYCGLERNEQAYGMRTKAADGVEYLSTLEAKFVDKFLYGRLEYEYEKPYPNNSGRVSDFYLPQLDLYIEIAGGLRPEVIAEKIEFCKRDNINLKVLYPKDLDKDFFGLACTKG